MVKLETILEKRNAINRLCEEWGFSVGFELETPALLIDSDFDERGMRLCLLVNTDAKLAEKDENLIKREYVRLAGLETELALFLNCAVSVTSKIPQGQNTISLNKNDSEILEFFSKNSKFCELTPDNKKEMMLDREGFNARERVKTRISATKHGNDYRYPFLLGRDESTSEKLIEDKKESFFGGNSVFSASSPKPATKAQPEIGASEIMEHLRSNSAIWDAIVADPHKLRQVQEEIAMVSVKTH